MHFPRHTTRKRIDLHCHSSASNRPSEALLSAIGCPESYSDPEDVRRQALSRGMDFVTLTDHDTIDGALRIAHHPDVIIGEELTCFFPEDNCKMHVLVWGLNADDHRALQSMARDIYRVAEYLEQRQLAHAVAHPLYRQNDKLQRWHLERLVLLFKGFECLNGGHSGLHREAFEPLLDHLTSQEIQRLSQKHRITPRWHEPHIKSRTGGSDDHGLLSVGRTWTELPDDVVTTEQALDAIRQGRCAPGGASGSGIKLAHTLYSIAARYCTRHVLNDDGAPNLSATIVQRLIGEGPGTNGTTGPVKPGLKRLARGLLSLPRKGVNLIIPRRWRRGESQRAAGLFRSAFEDSVMRRFRDHPDLLTAMSKGLPPMGEDQALFALSTQVTRDITDRIGHAISDSIARRQFTAFFDAVSAALAQQTLLLPYYFAFFHQNREKRFLRRLTEQADPPTAETMKIGLFTDVFDEVNGVCRFLGDMLQQANDQQRHLVVHTCCSQVRRDMPGRRNFAPLFSTPLPYYNDLSLVMPPLLEIMQWADAQQFDAIHVSTPGPMGLCGMLVARMLRVPLLGTYHTDLPSYVQRLTGDHRLTYSTAGYMRWFYSRLDRVFTRSRAYRDVLLELGVCEQALTGILPAINTRTFHPGRRDPEMWRQYGVTRPRRLLYCGRVSVEKDVPLLVDAFRQLCDRRNDVALIVAGDGPYLEKLRQSTRDLPVHCLGRLDDAQLAPLYASADLFVFPSRTDTLGQVVMEAQASGLPVLVSDQGGPREMVDDGLTGLVLHSADAARWCDAIDDLLNDEPRRQRMSRSAPLRMGRYSLANTFDAFWTEHLTVLRQLEDEPVPPEAILGPAGTEARL